MESFRVYHGIVVMFFLSSTYLLEIQCSEILKHEMTWCLGTILDVCSKITGGRRSIEERRLALR